MQSPPYTQNANCEEQSWRTLKKLVTNFIYEPNLEGRSGRTNWDVAFTYALHSYNKIPLSNFPYSREQIHFLQDQSLYPFPWVEDPLISSEEISDALKAYKRRD